MVALSARRKAELAAIAARYPSDQSLVLPFDITDEQAAAAAHAQIVATWSELDTVIVMAGDYRPLSATEFELAAANRLIAVNFNGTLNLLACAMPTMLARRHGRIALVSSVAGYCGLPRSLVYGPTKAALINLAEALYLELRPFGIDVHMVNPGFVATPLTAGNRFKMPALISADTAAREIMRGLSRGDFEIHFPKRFTRVLKLLRQLPYRWSLPLIARTTRQ